MAEAKSKQTASGISMDELRAELKKELLAELKSELPKAEMKSATPATDPSLEEYVEVQLFKDGRDYKDDVFVAVNGENCVIRRGVPVKIKRKFALLLEASHRQDVLAAEYAEKKQREYREQASQYQF